MALGLVDLLALARSFCNEPIRGRLAYATRENFMGRIVQGYHPEASDVVLFNTQAAHALCKAQNRLNKLGFSLYVFDAYRPLSAVQDFSNWFEEPPLDEYELHRKALHYPHIEKNQLSDLGYVAGQVSRHCFGFAIDLALFDLKTRQLVDMGAAFDYFDELSHTSATIEQIGIEAVKHRQLLTETLLSHGFLPYEKEYWHFDYFDPEREEPLDIEITSDLRNLGVASFESLR